MDDVEPSEARMWAAARVLHEVNSAAEGRRPDAASQFLEGRLLVPRCVPAIRREKTRRKSLDVGFFYLEYEYI